MPIDRVQIWNRTNTTKIADTVLERSEGGVWAPIAASARLQVVGDGGGDLSLPDGHPSIASATYRNVVRLVRISDEDVETKLASWTIDNIDQVKTAPSPQANKDFQVRGIGLLDRWNDCIILPWIPINDKPQTDVRLWNYASPGLDTSRAPWTTTVYQQVRNTSDPPRPIAYTDPVTSFIYGRPDPIDDIHPPEVWVFRKEFTITEAGVYAFYFTGDDRFRAWLDGTELEANLPEFPSDGWWYTFRAAVYLPVGDHVYAQLVQNDAGVGAMIANCWPTNGYGLISPPIWVSGVDGDPDNDFGDYIGEWWAANHTATPTGHTGPEILQRQLTEGQGRGGYQSMSIDVPDLDHDSAGNPAVIIPEVAAPIGSKGGSLISALEPWYDIVPDETADGLVTKIFNKATGMGGDSGVTYASGSNVKYLARHGSSANAV